MTTTLNESGITFKGEREKPIWVRLKEATRLYGFSRSTLYALMGAGKIKAKHIKSGPDSLRGYILLSTLSIEEFIEAQESMAKDRPAETKAQAAV